MPKDRVSAKLRDKLVYGQGFVPRAKEFVAEMIALAGGPRQLARILWDAIHEPRTPPSVKARALEIILKGMKKAEDDDESPDPTMLDDDDLARLLDERIKRQMRSEDGGAEEAEAGVQADVGPGGECI